MKFTEQDIREMVSESIKLIKENMQSELEAWHGSTSLFDKFDTNFIGTGESTQVYGWGLYMTGVKETGHFYAALIANKKHRHDKSNEWMSVSKIISDTFKPLFKKLKNGKIDFQTFKETAMRVFVERHIPQTVIEMFSKVNNGRECMKFEGHIQALSARAYKKYVYTVEIPDNGFIDWNSSDKDLIMKIYNMFAKSFDVSHVDMKKVKTFGDLYCALCGCDSLYKLKNPIIQPKEVSQYLKKIGFNGISVPIGNMYGGDSLGQNYVIFDTDDVKIKKVELA